MQARRVPYWLNMLCKRPCDWRFKTKPKMNRGTTGTKPLCNRRLDRFLRFMEIFSTVLLRKMEKRAPRMRPLKRATSLGMRRGRESFQSGASAFSAPSCMASMGPIMLKNDLLTV